VRELRWDPSTALAGQLAGWNDLAAASGVVCVIFDGPARDEVVEWPLIERWTRSRAVTAAEIRTSLGGAPLAVALCSDLVYLHPGVELLGGPGELLPGLVWALGRAGRASLARGLLDPSPISADEAVRLGLAQSVIGEGHPMPIDGEASVTALTVARDLARSSIDARAVLELASFRLLFAAGDPEEGARAFLERRDPVFRKPGG
jgi:enoyl-CoA hydratase/carnithine racemase